ncbi:GTPase HflX [Paremcibacter congregatus]|uniref:GTPase HflX n=1 Tax=Paremcibacter congregatus TaxID=2043170 RepID=UPI0030ED0020|tara:strand:+ start:5606 stop:7045 length:1440 start_codon:yes stop_codon:yes gene_type:complete
MTERTDSNTLKFRKKKIDLDWGKSTKEDDISPDHVAGANVLVLHPHLKKRLSNSGLSRPSHKTATSALRSPEARLEEAVGLCEALDLHVVHAVLLQLSKLVPATYMGQGKLDEMAALIAADDIELVIFDCELTPGQQRNIERILKVKVIDRTGLILEIFGERAQTKEGVLQVELAHLTYQKSRLVRSWTHLERQRGGFGFMGGPGESQIESDRRMISDRIGRIGRQLEEVSRTRKLHRAGRQKQKFPVVAMVGYTNAGKSTLFNYLTGASVMAEDLLFATLDPTMREIDLPNDKKAILSDTVGFISQLPTQLVAAFQATLEEVVEADLILHVRDISHPDTEAQREDVMTILHSLGLEEGPECAIHEVWSKIDLLSTEQRATVENLAALKGNVSLLSAITGEGCEEFRIKLNDLLASGAITLKIAYKHQQGAEMAWMYKNGEVIAREDGETETILTVRVDQKLLGRIEKDTRLVGRVIET